MASITRRDLTLDMVELTGEARVPEVGELWVHGVAVFETNAATAVKRAIVRIKASPVPKMSDLFKDLPPMSLEAEQESPKPRYEV